MIITEHLLPSPHIIVDELFDDDTLKKIKNEVSQLKDKTKPGLFINGNNEETVNTDIKKNNNIWLDNLYSDRRNESIILTELPKKIWNDLSEFLNNSKSSIFRVYNKTNTDNTLFSAYRNNDFYSEHRDICTDNGALFLTSNLMLKLSGNFKGGDFILQNETIPFKDNRLIIFESHRLHSVSKVETDDNPENWRYSVQYFAKIK